MEERKRRGRRKKSATPEAEPTPPGVKEQPQEITTEQTTEKAKIVETFHQESVSTSQPPRLSLLQKKVKEIKDRVNEQLAMAKNMYVLLQGMKQSYGGDMKKVMLAILAFAREEGKRRINEMKTKVRKKLLGELD